MFLIIQVTTVSVELSTINEILFLKYVYANRNCKSMNRIFLTDKNKNRNWIFAFGYVSRLGYVYTSNSWYSLL
jgi:hypothetical protein